MRLALCTLSAVLLSGCSWLGGGGNVFNGANQGQHAQSGQYNYNGRYKAGSQHGQHQYQSQNPCQVYAPQAPVPQGCHPSQVTLGTAGGFPQQPNFGGGQYANQGYGSHADVAHKQADNYQPRKSKLRKPRFRGSLSLGLEKSVSGSFLDFSELSGLDPAVDYNPQTFNQVFTSIDPVTGAETTTTYTANSESRNAAGVPVAPNSTDIFNDASFNALNAADISFDDVHSTPLRIAGGAEYIISPRATLFANAGYSYAEGNDGTVARVSATPFELTSVQNFVNGVATGAPVETVVAGQNTEVASFQYDFGDQERIDLEVGGRYYFKPVNGKSGFKTLTPFVGGAVGASHYNSVAYDVVQTQSLYSEAFVPTASADTFELSGPSRRVELYDSQWVPSGQLNVGMEWQVTPKTALAFETGLRIEGARDYANDVKGDENIAIPMTIRGSYNF